MKVSVIIPAHNEAESIAQTLTAICAQDYPDFEVIVVDNASTDATSQAAKKFPVKVLREDRKGTQWALECGRAAAKGEVIARLDADCLPERNWLSKGVECFADPKVVGVTGPYDYYDGTPSFRSFSLFWQKTVYSFMNWLLQTKALNMGGILIGGNSFMLASTLEKIHGFDTRIVFYGDDMDTAKRISVFGKIVFRKDLAMKTSARRMQKQGIIKIGAMYIFYFFKVIFGGFWQKLRGR